jgi:hypothetical protein
MKRNGPHTMHTLDSKSKMQGLQASLTQTAEETVTLPRRMGPMLGSMGLSLLVHGLVVLIFTIATWAVISEPKDPEFSAEIIQPPLQVGSGRKLDFHDQTTLQGAAINDKAPVESVSADLKTLLEKNASVEPKPLVPASGGLDTLAIKDLERRDVVGIGIGAGNSPGRAEGISGRDVAGGGPVGSLWGVGANQSARSVVYVMDRSGSMSDTFGLLQHELIRAIGTLNREQLFNVIWFNEGKPEELFVRMKEASIDNKRAAFEAIKHVVPSGQTEPVEALKRGLGFRPDVMFLLSDGDFGEENVRVLNTIRQRNKSKTTTINTILFVYDTMGEGERVLRQIATENRGIYKHVTEEDTRG